MRSIKFTDVLTRGRGFEEHITNLYSAAIYESMIKLLGVSIGLRVSNIDIGMKRCICDYYDCQRFFKWFEIENSFSIEHGNIYSLSAGVVSVYGKELRSS